MRSINMKRKELEELGLEKEVIDKIMGLHGTTIETTKKQHEEIAKQLEEANNKIVDIENIKKTAGTHEKLAKELALKLEQTQKEAETKAYEAVIKDHLNDFKFSSSPAKREMIQRIKEKNLALEGDKLLGFVEYMEVVKKDEPDLFKSDEAVQKVDMAKKINPPDESQDRLNNAFNTLLKER